MNSTRSDNTFQDDSKITTDKNLESAFNIK